MALTKVKFSKRADIAEMAATSFKNESRVELNDGSRYEISATDLGSGVLLASGNYANRVDELPISISTATNLVSGRNYVSTATASHVVPAASGGAPIEITWLDGTIMTLTSASNISITTNIKTTDTTWVFENFIQTLTLFDNSTEWEIK